jgi:DNA-binding IclR family transcriptional regulator
MKKPAAMSAQVPAVRKALDLLEYLAVRNGGQTVQTAARALRIPQASAFRIVNTLIARSYLVRQAGQEGPVTLGPRTALFARAALNVLKIVEHARPVMEKLLEKTRKTVELTYYANDEITFVHVLESPEPIKYMRRVGVPVIGSANPATLAVLAHLSSEKQRALVSKMAVLRKSMVKLNPALKKIQFKRKIKRKALIKVKSNGYAADFGKQVRHVSRIACPILGPLGIAGTIGIAGPSFYIKTQNASRLIKQVRRAAEELSRSLGAVPLREGQRRRK